MTGDPEPGTLAAADPSTVIARGAGRHRRPASRRRRHARRQRRPPRPRRDPRRHARGRRHRPPPTGRHLPLVPRTLVDGAVGEPHARHRRRRLPVARRARNPRRGHHHRSSTWPRTCRRGGRRSAPTPARPAPTTTSPPISSTSSSPPTGSSWCAGMTARTLIELGSLVAADSRAMCGRCHRAVGTGRLAAGKFKQGQDTIAADIQCFVAEQTS